MDRRLARPPSRPPLLSLSFTLIAFSACGDISDRREVLARDAGRDAQVDARSEGGLQPADDGSVASADASSANDAATPSTDGSAGAVDGGTPSDLRDAAQDAGGDATLTMPPAHTFVYVGGYSNDDGLRAFELNRSSFTLSPIAQSADVGPQPSYLTPSANGRTLYVTNEANGNPGITVLRLNETTGVPTRVDHEDAITSSFVFSALSPDNRYLLASSYNGGNLAVYPVKADGTLDPRVDARDFGGSSQTHSVRVHASGKWAYVPNKGLDSVAQLRFDAATGKLTDNAPPTFAAQPSATSFDGPRHIAFSRDGKLAFVVLELGNALFSLTVGAEGALAEADRKPREAENAAAGHTGAHVLAHPTANFVYASNRGTNTVAAFSYDALGRLTLIGRVPTRGNTPRNFDIDPLGKVLIVANEDSGSVAVFAIEDNGSLTAKGNLVTGLDSPAAVAIVAL